MHRPIYMDHHATTPIDPDVLAAMMPYLTESFGNAASKTHALGWQAEEAVEQARERVAFLIGCDPEEIIFTSGATESDNLAIKGIAWAYGDKKNHIVATAIEHKAVLDPARFLARQGFEITVVPVDSHGMVDPGDVSRAITERTLLVSVMYANGEIGTVQPMREIAGLARERGVLVHTDAAQAVGKIPFSVKDLGVDLASISGHKIYGPKGIGALYVRKRRPSLQLIPLVHGGGQERGLRSGTLNVPGIVGLGMACEIAGRVMSEESKRLAGLRERLRQRIMDRLDSVYLNGHPLQRLPGNLNLSFRHIEGESLLLSLGGAEIAVSSGSACSSGSPEASYVLSAIGLGEDLARTAIRFGLGRHNTDEEVDFVADSVVRHATRLREMVLPPGRSDGGTRLG